VEIFTSRAGETRDIAFVVTVVDAGRVVSQAGLGTSGAWTFTREWNLVERRTGDTMAASMKPYWQSLEFSAGRG